MRPALAPALLVAFASAVSAQQVLVVDASAGAGSSFTEIADAVAAASEGDVILVRSGTYATFSIVAKSLALAAEVGASVTVSGGFSVEGLGAAQQVLARGFVADQAGPLTLFRFANNAGSVRIEECAVADPGFDSTGEGPASSVTNCASLSFARCTLRGGNGEAGGFLPPTTGSVGITLTASNVALYDSTCAGGIGGNVYGSSETDGAKGGIGVLLHSGHLFLSGTTIAGGEGGFGGTSSFPFEGDGGHGGDGLVLDGAAASAVTLDSTFLGGIGGESGWFSLPALPGAPTTILAGSLTTLSGTARSFAAASPVRELESALLRFRGVEGDLAFALYAPLAGASIELFALSGIVLVDLATAQIAGLGVIPPASDTLLVSVSMPLLPPSVAGMPVFAQGLLLPAAPGALPVLGAPSALVLLDASL